MEDYEKFFSRMEDYLVDARFYENNKPFEIEELYQAFKSRAYSEIKDDLIADVQDMLSRNGIDE